MNTEKEIIVVSSDKKQCEELRRLFKEKPYRVTSTDSLSNLEASIQSTGTRTLLVDLDGMAATGRFFKDLKKTHPSLSIMGISSRSFHPELEDVIGSHIFACLKKPVDSDELFYLLKSIYDNKTNSVESL